MKFQWTIKTVVFAVLGGGLILVCLFYPLNDLLATRVFQTQAKCVELRSSFVPGDMGTNGEPEYVFELADGQRVYLKKLAFVAPVEVGETAVLHYRQGIFFGNKMYDRYEPVAKLE